MTGKSERIKRYTADELDAMIERGEDATDWDMSQEEAMRRRRQDPESPRPYRGWEKTVTVELPRPKAHMNLRIDADVVDWFKRQGKGYQTLMNAVLRAYMEAHRSEPPR